MKCPSCGAEVGKSKFCEYCGTQITVDMLREQEQLNKNGCPKCGSTNITFMREKQGEMKGKKGMAVVRSTTGLCKDCGYTWYTDQGNAFPKKRKTWLWVLGWIFIFPVPVTILMLRKKTMKPVLKYGIIAVAWLVYLIIGFSGKSNEATNTLPVQETAGNTGAVVAAQQAKEEKTTENSVSEEKTSENSGSKEELQRLLKQKENLTWKGNVNEDVTGNWRWSEYSSPDSQETIAVEYYNAFFEGETEIHALINRTNKTTGRMQMLGSRTMVVTILKYVENEENSAKSLFGGEMLSQYHINLDTGDIEKIQ